MFDSLEWTKRSIWLQKIRVTDDIHVGNGKVFDILVSVYEWIILSTCHASLKHAALFLTWPILRYSDTPIPNTPIIKYVRIKVCHTVVLVSNEQSCLEVEYRVQVQTKANSLCHIELWLKADFFLARASISLWHVTQNEVTGVDLEVQNVQK